MHRCLAVALSVLAFAAHADPPRLTLSSAIVVRDAPREFGGLSALIVREQGDRALMLSDRGKYFDVGLPRDADGVLQSVTVLTARYLFIYEPGVPVDSEGLAPAPDGGYFVATENPSRVLHYETGRSWPNHTTPFPELPFRKANRGLEALAVDPEGRPLTIPEAPPDGEPGFPIYRLEGETWARIGQLEQRGRFLVVGADFGPDGRLYVLERAVSLLGFRSRIRRVTLAEGEVRDETLLESRLGEYDNLEGLSLWRDGAGAIRITLVSDNNFLPVQRTEIVEFILHD